MGRWFVRFNYYPVNTRQVAEQATCLDSVPSAGIVYFLPDGVTQWFRGIWGFSPLSGDCLFLTKHLTYELVVLDTFQSPQRGLFISYAASWTLEDLTIGQVSVPSAGIVYFLRIPVVTNNI